jgi:sugar/nucleoside kinase (ribokinase family)
MAALFQIPSGRRFDVICFGSNAVDELITVERFPEFNTKTEFISHQRLPGGEAASTAVGLKRLGVNAIYIGSFGDDDEGALGLRSLQAEGIDTKYCRIVKGARTQSAFIIVDVRNGERTILWKRDERLNFPKEELPIALAGETAILHTTAHDIEPAIALAKKARSEGTLVSIDIDSPVPGYEELLRSVDICIVSEGFPRSAFGADDIADGLMYIRREFGCSTVGATLGAEGSAFLRGDDLLFTPAFVSGGGCVDTTGAGDAFRAGFLYGVVSGWDLKKSALAANAVAALKCRKAGARAGLPNEREVSTLLKIYGQS